MRRLDSYIRKYGDHHGRIIYRTLRVALEPAQLVGMATYGLTVLPPGAWAEHIGARTDG